jgi:NAD-dependent DNA ligase
VLRLGLLFLAEPLTIECGKELVKVRGSYLASLNAGSGESTELQEIGDVLKGNGKGTPNITTYFNDKGETEKAKLEANTGAGFVEADEEEEEGEVKTKALEGKMFVITGR